MTARWTFGAYRSSSRMAIAFFIVGTTSLALAVTWAWQVRQDLAAVHRLQQEAFARNERTLAQAKEVRARALQLAAQRRHDPKWVSAERELALPWVATLSALERTTRPPVYVLAFKPDMNDGLLTIEGESDDLTDVLRYVSELEKDDDLEGVRLLNHQTSRHSESGRSRVVFTLRGKYAHAATKVHP